MAEHYTALALDYVKLKAYEGTQEDVRKNILKDFTGRVLVLKLPFKRCSPSDGYQGALIRCYDPAGGDLEALKRDFGGGSFHFTRGKEGLLIINLSPERCDFISKASVLEGYAKEYYDFSFFLLKAPEKHLVFRKHTAGSGQ